MTKIIQNLPDNIGFLISKGGTTSNILLSRALKLKSIHLLEQIIPGCSVVKTESNNIFYSELLIILFPGNLGSARTLINVHNILNRV